MAIDGPQRALAPSREPGLSPSRLASAHRKRNDAHSEERRVLRSYAQPHLGRSLTQIATSIVPYVALLIVMYRMIDVSLAIVLLLAIPTAGFQVRTFIVFHDCSHGSFLPSKRANAWLGALLGLLVLAPYRRWSHDHAVHHATSGDLDRRGVGDIPTLTLTEYAARSRRGRLAYRLFRHPLIMFGLGPILAMMIGPRITSRSQRPRLRNSVLGTDVALALMIGGLCWLIGWEDFLLVWAPSSLLAGSAGIWLFYVQHQFEDTYWTAVVGLELRRRRVVRELVSQIAKGVAVLLRQHWPASRSPSQRKDPQLQPPAGARREFHVPTGAGSHAPRRIASDATQNLGRIPGRADHLCPSPPPFGTAADDEHRDSERTVNPTRRPCS